MIARLRTHLRHVGARPLGETFAARRAPVATTRPSAEEMT